MLVVQKLFVTLVISSQAPLKESGFYIAAWVYFSPHCSCTSDFFMAWDLRQSLPIMPYFGLIHSDLETILCVCPYDWHFMSMMVGCNIFRAPSWQAPFAFQLWRAEPSPTAHPVYAHYVLLAQVGSSCNNLLRLCTSALLSGEFG